MSFKKAYDKLLKYGTNNLIEFRDSDDFDEEKNITGIEDSLKENPIAENKKKDKYVFTKNNGTKVRIFYK